jgi:hypothetical protein
LNSAITADSRQNYQTSLSTTLTSTIRPLSPVHLPSVTKISMPSLNHHTTDKTTTTTTSSSNNNNQGGKICKLIYYIDSINEILNFE